MSYFGENLRINIFGQSHSDSIGVTIEGIPAGEMIDMDELLGFMARRAPGKTDISTSRKEDDIPEFICGIVDDHFCGAPVTAIIKNTDAKKGDYLQIRNTPRPGHADYTAEVKYSGYQVASGGGAFSGRMTAPLCIAGGICLQILRRHGISVISRILSIGGINDEGELTESVADRAFPCISSKKGEQMRQLILSMREDGDSVGGTVECIVNGAPAGLGGPMFQGLESRISAIVFGIPAVKGIEFGAGFGYAKMRGSEGNDAFIIKNDTVLTETNNCGGILGGISDGMPIRFVTAVKPTPSICRQQKTVDLAKRTNTVITVGGRHDPCIVPRILPCIESAAAIALYDAILERKKEL